jgi:hypothetical protein
MSLICSICSCAFPFHRACDQSHTGVCHACAELNWSGALLDNPAHDAPPPPALPPPVCEVLDAATAAALDAYAAHVQRTEAAGGRGLGRGED